ncbi:MAG: flagellar filament capping protein FliD, partial [Cellulomonadaceae bacterium]|nr:flagellar filament capping protein FliD [Cellulomonadaceae bacterium]
LSAASAPVNGFSPNDVGIVTSRDGTFTFDKDKFAKALAADPVKVQAMISGIAGRVATVATSLSDKTTGTFTQKITGQQSRVKDYGTQIENWDLRLEMRRAALEKTYAALEVSLSNLNAQSSWLTSQLDSLSTSSSSS